MSPFNTLTPEQQIQVLIVRIDMWLVAIWRVLRVAVPVIILIALMSFVLTKLWRGKN